jgi:glycosyltransferase involved in cell wall biosynthesis
MRIGLFTDMYIPEICGPTNVVHLLREELGRLGHDVYIYAPQYPHHHPEEEEGVFRFRARPFLFYKTSQFALPYSREATRSFQDLDIAHSHTPFSLGAVALGTALRHRIPHVHTYHGYLTEYRHYFPRPLRPPKRAVEEFSALFCNRCTLITTPSAPIKEALIRYGVHRPIHVLPFGVNLRSFEQDSVWSPRSALEIPTEAPLFLCSGRLAREKNLSFLLRAFDEIHARLPEAVLVLTGDGPEREALQNQVRQSGSRHAVIFTGFLDYDKLIDLYRAADLFLFASKTETQGLVLVEAMAGGTPVVAIGELGVVDVVKDNLNGVLVPENEQKFAQAALELWNDRPRYEDLRAGARETAETLSSRNCTLRFLEIYETCLSRAKPNVRTS